MGMLDYYKGMDLSFLPQGEAEGMTVRDFDGTVFEPLALAQKYGVNAVRLRLWNNPENVPESGGYCSLSDTIAMAKRIKRLNMDFMLDFHYSDYWADPAKQEKPKAWKNLSFEELKEAVFDFTSGTLLAMKKEGVLPDIVQIGNEIRSGLLFPDGELPDYRSMVQLVNAGIAAARQAGGSGLLIMIHLDQGGRYFYLKEWFDNAFSNGLSEFDLIGISYYPFWHGTFADLKETMESLVREYKKPVIIAETAHAWRLSEKGFIDSQQERIAGFPATPEGQRKVLELVMNISASLPDKMGRGIFYWEPFCVPKAGEGGWAENMGLLKPDGSVLEGMKAFPFERQDQRFEDAAKIYAAEEILVPTGGSAVLPQEAGILFYDGTVEKRPVLWDTRALENISGAAEGEYVIEGTVEGVGETISVKVKMTDREEEAENLLHDPNWEEGFVWWELSENRDGVTVHLEPEYVNPFPAPPVNALRVDAVKNFDFQILQKTVPFSAGTYVLEAEFQGTDTTNVDIRLFLKDENGFRETVVHPTEHEWTKFAVCLEVRTASALWAGIRIVSPPIYGLVKNIRLTRKKRAGQQE